MTALVQVEDLVKRYESRGTDVLKGISFSVDEEEFVAIMGPSGSGKSTLLHLIGGLDRATGGRVYLHGRCHDDLSDKELSSMRRREIGFVFQFFNLIPVLTAGENTAMPLILDGMSRAEALRRAEEVLEEVGLEHRANHRPSELSGGEQQRVAIARATVARPNLILADEPTGALDTRTGDEIVGLLRKTAGEHHHAVLMVTHDPRVAARAQRILYLRDGRITEDNHVEASGRTSDGIANSLRRQAT